MPRKTVVYKGKEYTHCVTNQKGNFIYDWEDYCEVEPNTEEVYEDEVGNEYVLYKDEKGQLINNGWLNID